MDQEQSPEFCNDINSLPESQDIDPVPPYCGDTETQKRKGGFPDEGWKEPGTFKKTGFGQSAQCDPIQKGHIINDPNNPDRNTIYRYSQSLKGCDDAMLNLFNDIIVIDDDGKAHKVPIIWGTQERAVAALIQSNVRKDNSLVVDRIRLPMLAIYASDLQFNQGRFVYHMARVPYYWKDKPLFNQQEKYPYDTVFRSSRGIPVDIGYTLFIWTKYEEDMNQINEQILTKFSPVAYIRVKGISIEIIVKLDSILNNFDTEPGEGERVLKFQYNFTVESYIPQPIDRRKTVLKTKIDIFNNVNEDEISESLKRIEETTEDFK